MNYSGIAVIHTVNNFNLQTLAGINFIIKRQYFAPLLGDADPPLFDIF